MVCPSALGISTPSLCSAAISSSSRAKVTMTLASTIRPFLLWAWFTKSGKRSARIPLEPANPRANSNASKIFDLPDPLGPETTVKPCKSGIEVVEPKDLNLVSSTFLMYIVAIAGLVNIKKTTMFNYVIFLERDTFFGRKKVPIRYHNLVKMA